MVRTSVPEPVTEGAARAQRPATAVPVESVAAQESATTPVKGPRGVTVKVAVLPVVAPVARERVPGMALSAKLEVTVEPVMTASTPVVWTYAPVESVPVMATL